MEENFFWKSALKASVVVNFFLMIFSLLYFFIGDLKSNGLMYGLVGLQNLGLYGILVSIILPLQVFGWLLFGYFYGKFPVKQSFLKVFLFSLVFYGLLFLFLSFFNRVNLFYFLLFGLLDFFWSGVFLFLVQVISFYFLFEFFKKQEDFSLESSKVVVSAGLGKRAIAFFIDYFLLWALNMVCLMVLFFELSETFMSYGFVEGITIGGAFGSIFWILINFSYWVLIEGFFGVTIGKKLMKIKVVKENGEKIKFSDSFFRNVWKFFPFFEWAAVLDLWKIQKQENRQRLLDQVAGTIVVEEKKV